MKKIFIALGIVLVLALAACSLQEYLPDTMILENETNDTELILFNDSFEFVNETDDVQEEVVDENDTSTEKEDLTPVFATVTVTEGEIVSLAELQAKDPDGDTIKYDYADPFNEQGLWQTNEGDAGKYLTTVKASDGVLSTTEQVQIVVLPTNKGPVIDCPDEFEAYEGETIDLPCIIFDREGDDVTFEVSGFMDELTYETNFDDAGDYTVVITASDGSRTTVKEIDLSILEKNRPPVVQPVEEITVQETETVTLDLNVDDPDGDAIEINYPVLFDDEGVWETQKGDAGMYELEAVVSDGGNDVTVPISIVVEKLNVPPTLEPIGLIIVDEGDIIDLDIEAYDEDGDDVTVTISGFMTEEVYQTDYDDAGEYSVLVQVADEKHVVEENVSIIINNVNRPPVFKLPEE